MSVSNGQSKVFAAASSGILHTCCAAEHAHTIIPVAKAVGVQVVDVCHVDGVLKHTPVAAVKLNLTIHCNTTAVTATAVTAAVAAAPGWVVEVSWGERSREERGGSEEGREGGV